MEFIFVFYLFLKNQGKLVKGEIRFSLKSRNLSKNWLRMYKIKD